MIQGFNPRTGERTGKPLSETTDAEVDAAVEAAAAALPAWAGLDGEERARALEAVAAALDAHAGELVPLADEETALGETRLTGEVARTTGQLRLFAGVLRDGGYADPVTSPPGGGIAEIRRINHPAGPVAVFAASNFPFAFSVAGGDTASALAAGLPGGGQGTRGAPGDLGADRPDRHRRPGRGRAPRRDVRPGTRVRGRGAAAHPPGDQRGRVHRLHPRRARTGPALRGAGGPDPVLR